jgi:hypothetical protein
MRDGGIGYEKEKAHEKRWMLVGFGGCMIGILALFSTRSLYFVQKRKYGCGADGVPGNFVSRSVVGVGHHHFFSCLFTIFFLLSFCFSSRSYSLSIVIITYTVVLTFATMCSSRNQ